MKNCQILYIEMSSSYIDNFRGSSIFLLNFKRNLSPIKSNLNIYKGMSFYLKLSFLRYSIIILVLFSLNVWTINTFLSSKVGRFVWNWSWNWMNHVSWVLVWIMIVVTRNYWFVNYYCKWIIRWIKSNFIR